MVITEQDTGEDNTKGELKQEIELNDVRSGQVRSGQVRG